MFLTNLFNFKKVCSHDKITPDMESGYCPDCGKFIKNEWYITRCACCGVKLKTVSIKGEIRPHFHYCTNCGGEDFSVEKLDKINFIDINFAVLVKTEKDCNAHNHISTTQCWQERTTSQPKLLVQYL